MTQHLPAEPNPFRPPQAAVTDTLAAGGHQAPSVISARGRIGRLRLFVYVNTAYVLFYTAGILLMLIGMGVFILPAAMQGGSDNGMELIFGGMAGAFVIVLLVVVPLMVLLAVYFVLKLIQRSHDMGWSGWTVLLTLIPLVVLVWYVKKGDSGPNAYGPPPTPNGPGLKVGGAIFGILLGLSLLAGLLAPLIPHGQDDPHIDNDTVQEQPV